MSRKIHKLTERKDLDFEQIGISSAENDYRLSWSLNNSFNLQLIRNENLEVFHKRLESRQEFSQFQYYDDSSLILYRLLSNRSENGNLLEELTNVDYVMQISGDLERGQTDQLVKDLNALASIRLAFKIDAAVLKSVHKLIL